MATEVVIKIHDVADGLPDMEKMTGRVAFIFDGCLVSGWPVRPDNDGTMLWEGDSDVSHGRLFYGVTHWVEFPEPVWELSRG